MSARSGVDADHHRRRLRHRLDDGDAGHDRRAGEMALEMRLVEGDVLDAGGGFRAVDVDHPVDQQERIAVRDDPLDQVDIGGLQVGHRRVLVMGRGRRRDSNWSGPRQAFKAAAGCGTSGARLSVGVGSGVSGWVASNWALIRSIASSVMSMASADRITERRSISSKRAAFAHDIGQDRADPADEILPFLILQALQFAGLGVLFCADRLHLFVERIRQGAEFIGRQVGAPLGQVKLFGDQLVPRCCGFRRPTRCDRSSISADICSAKREPLNKRS